MRTTVILPRRFLLLLLVPAILVVVGTAGYMIIQGWSLFDSLYMTVITLTTVGYGEIPEPLSQRGRAFTMALLIVGVFTMFYAAAEIIRAVVSGEVQTAMGKQYQENRLAQLTNHLIVCGFGRMGKLVCQEFENRGLPFVIIDSEPKRLQGFTLSRGIAVVGDATHDEVLLRSGVERAHALIAVLASDADNLYITMSARLLNADLFIVARAEGEKSEQKLLRAGADRVVAPYVLGGSVVAQAVLKPTVVDFIELATRTEHLALQIEETKVGAGSELAGQTIRDSNLRGRLGVIVVAIKKDTGHMVFNPPGEAVMEPGDILITLGDRHHLDELDRLAEARKR